MADVRRRFFLRHLRGTPTTWIRHQVVGRVRREGTGRSFWYRPLTAVLSEVPVDDRELPLLFHARTADFTDVTVQATVTYRVADPAVAASRLDFSIDPDRGTRRGQPLEQVASLLAEVAQQPALDLLARMSLTEALTAGIAPVRAAVSAALGDDPRLAEIGVRVISARVVAIRPEPELERALQTPTREAVQVEADRATYARRARAVEQERAIAENELQNQIELARREQQLVDQRGANDRRTAELSAAAALVTAQGADERARLQAAAEADRDRALAEARAVGINRDDLPGFPFGPEDIVVAVGPDGLVANVAKYLSGQPVVGVDPEPGRNPGVLVRFDPAALVRLLPAVAAGTAPVEARTMVTAALDDGQRLIGLNEIYVGHRSHQSARYVISTADGSSERQSSSGVVVGTGTGATGWCASIARERWAGPALPGPAEPALHWFVREAWPSPATGVSLTAGRLASGEPLHVISEVDGLVVFADGMESDRLVPAWGQRVSVMVADGRLHLVSPG